MNDLLELLDAKDPVAVPPPVNRQLYENSGLAGSAIENAAAGPDALFGARLPNFAIVHEKPEHRLIVYLKAKGKSNRAIAKQLGYTDAWVSQIVRQPWFQVRLMQELKQEGQDAAAFGKNQIELSLLTICTLRDSATSEAVRFQSANSILDRYLGKPVQRMRDESKPLSAQEKEMLSIEDELKELEEEEKRLLGEGEGSGGDSAAPAVAADAAQVPTADLTNGATVESAESSKKPDALPLAPAVFPPPPAPPTTMERFEKVLMLL